PVEVCARALGHENTVVSLSFANGTHGTISYLTEGDRSYSKERLEVFGGGSIAVLDDFHRLERIRRGRKKVIRARLRQDKDHSDEWQAFSTALRTGAQSPIPFFEIVATTLATIRAVESLSSGRPVPVSTQEFINSHVRPVPSC